MAQAVPCPAKPSARLRRAAIEPRCSPFPHVVCRVVNIQNPSGMGAEALVKQTPQPPAAIAEPDDLGSAQDTLPERFEPQTRLEGIDSTQDGHQAAMREAGDEFSRAGAMVAQASEPPHCDLTP